MHYQPIVDIAAHRVVALEALLRWKHPTHGFVPPERFVAVAEETGLIVPIGDFVLERAIEDMARWRAGGLRRSCRSRSTSPRCSCSAPTSPGRSRGCTQASASSPACCSSSSPRARCSSAARAATASPTEDAVARLRELGVRIAIDDFGTGYSSLSYLKRWRVDYLKIDRSFVRDLVTDMSDLAIVGAIIAMARHLHIQVVAEGIEGWQQLEKLRQLGCSYAQGYLFARPAPSSSAGATSTAAARSHPAPADARESREHRQRRIGGDAGLRRK